MKYWSPLLLAALLTTALWSLPSGATQPAPLDYVEQVFGAPREAALPLLVAVHGLGDTPENFAALFADLGVPVRLIAPRAPDPHAVGSSWFPLEDPEAGPRLIRERAGALARLLQQLRRTRPTRGRPVVTGFSQGGVLSFALAAYHAPLLSAALPVAGLLPAGGPALRAPPASAFRVVALHGRSDQRIPYARGVEAVERLRKAGYDATMLDFAEVGHGFSPALLARYQTVLRAELTRAAAAR